MVYLDIVHRHSGEFIKSLGEMEIEEAEMRVIYDPIDKYEVEPGIEVPAQYRIRNGKAISDEPAPKTIVKSVMARVAGKVKKKK